MRVAVAIITDAQKRVLITQRPLHVPHGGFWEFPGGKVEPSETPAEALIREIQEEVGLVVLAPAFLGEVNHTYGDRSVSLQIFRVNQFEGQATCLEGQLDLRWVNVSELDAFTFPAANRDVMRLFRNEY